MEAFDASVRDNRDRRGSRCRRGYFGVADHSISAHYAGGLSLEEIAEQHREADRLNKRYGKSFCILKGIEADILGDGSLDYPDRVLSKFDLLSPACIGASKCLVNDAKWSDR